MFYFNVTVIITDYNDTVSSPAQASSAPAAFLPKQPVMSRTCNSTQQPVSQMGLHQVCLLEILHAYSEFQMHYTAGDNLACSFYSHS